MTNQQPVKIQIIQPQNLIYDIRGIKIMLDSDLAYLYEIPVKRLNEAVKRNINRFPLDFMFQLTDLEWTNLKSQFATSSYDLASKQAIIKGNMQSLRSQIVTSNCGLALKTSKITDFNENLKSQIATSSQWGGRRKLPFVFTEQGVAMLSSVLNSPRAIEINIAIMRAFIQIRHFVQKHLSVTDEIKELKQMLLLHIDNTKAGFHEHTERINEIITVLNNLIEQPSPPKKIGFHP